MPAGARFGAIWQACRCAARRAAGLFTHACSHPHYLLNPHRPPTHMHNYTRQLYEIEQILAQLPAGAEAQELLRSRM